MPDQPPYLRIATLLRQHIKDRHWKPGDRLPPRRTLAQEWSVGENVIRRAQELLIAQGLLRSRKGSGMYVAHPRARIRLVRAEHREERSGSPVPGPQGMWTSHSQGSIPAPAEVAARLDIPEGDLCVCTRYELLVDSRTAQSSTSWEPDDLMSRARVDLPEGEAYAGRTIVARMARIGITVTHSTEHPEPGKATAEEAAAFGLPQGSLLTRIERTHYSDEGRPVETADIVIPAAFCEIEYEVPVTP